ncbi:hypothetical protein LB507_008713 [Fusarium sp. FIESC RH6]|nr:hypothetical protein LB507_008713 [Fusarium sp. FIESC RH6]
MAGEAADESLNNLISGVDGLGIADGSDGRQLPQTLTTAIEDLDQTVKYLNEQAANIETLLSSNSDLINGYTATASRLYRQSNNIERVSLWLNNAVVQSIVAHITSLDNRRYSDTPKLLKHFDDSIKAIARRFLSQGNVDYPHTLWRIVEECCIQAVPSGKLDPDQYFASITEPERPWHPNQDLGVLQRYIDGSKKSTRDEWARFWAECLNECPGGPTLFIPPKHSSPFQQSPPAADDPPKYLFRAYDSVSGGINNSNFIAPATHVNRAHWVPKLNVLFGNAKLPPTNEEKALASKMVHSHLLGPYLKDGYDIAWIREHDNLVSWSSSLMVVIQYANFKFCRTGQDVSICAVDTERFPKGQFVRDRWLLDYFSQGSFNKEERWLRGLPHQRDWKDFHLPHGFNNGEYLSQGMLNVAGRSCTLSLRAMKQAGLWSLYPEFDINSAESSALVRKKWTEYVILLRERWEIQRETTKNEIGLAVEIARRCFDSFDEMDITLLLLAFRSRSSKGGGKFQTILYLQDG